MIPKYRVSLSVTEIKFILAVMGSESTTLSKKLRIILTKIENDMLKPEFTQSEQSMQKENEKQKEVELTLKVTNGTATEEEKKELNMILFGVSL